MAEVLRWSCGDRVKPGETYMEHVRACLERAHWKCLAQGAWRETWLYVDSYLVILCECDTVLDIICEHQKGVWPNNKSVCEWDEAGENLTCTRCGIDAT